jgi:hypothetical protein
MGISKNQIPAKGAGCQPFFFSLYTLKEYPQQAIAKSTFK